MELPDDFLYNLAQQAAQTAASASEIKALFRKNLHNVIAPYLEEIDYSRETKRLIEEPGLLDNLSGYCLDMMQKHASTRERIPILEEFFAIIAAEIGQPSSILDLACALDPLCLPWIKLSDNASFFAYDIHGTRIAYLNQLFALAFPFATAIREDILVNPPTQAADCAFFFKEAHRLEKRQAGATAHLLNNLNVKVVVLSLPTADLTGHHSLENYHSQLVERAIQGQPISSKKVRVANELLFFLRKELN